MREGVPVPVLRKQQKPDSSALPHGSRLREEGGANVAAPGVNKALTQQRPEPRRGVLVLVSDAIGQILSEFRGFLRNLGCNWTDPVGIWWLYRESEKKLRLSLLQKFVGERLAGDGRATSARGQLNPRDADIFAGQDVRLLELLDGGPTAQWNQRYLSAIPAIPDPEFSELRGPEPNFQGNQTLEMKECLRQHDEDEKTTDLRRNGTLRRE